MTRSSRNGECHISYSKILTYIHRFLVYTVSCEVGPTPVGEIQLCGKGEIQKSQKSQSSLLDGEPCMQETPNPRACLGRAAIDELPFCPGRSAELYKLGT